MNTFIRQQQQTIRAGKTDYTKREERKLSMIKYCKHSHKTLNKHHQ